MFLDRRDFTGPILVNQTTNMDTHIGGKLSNVRLQGIIMSIVIYSEVIMDHERIHLIRETLNQELVLD